MERASWEKSVRLPTSLWWDCQVHLASAWQAVVQIFALALWDCFHQRYFPEVNESYPSPAEYHPGTPSRLTQVQTVWDSQTAPRSVRPPSCPNAFYVRMMWSATWGQGNIINHKTEEVQKPHTKDWFVSHRVSSDVKISIFSSKCKYSWRKTLFLLKIDFKTLYSYYDFLNQLLQILPMSPPSQMHTIFSLSLEYSNMIVIIITIII